MIFWCQSATAPRLLFPVDCQKQLTTDLPPSAGRFSGSTSGPKVSRRLSSNAPSFAPGWSILLTTITRHRLRALACSIIRWVP